MVRTRTSSLILTALMSLLCACLLASYAFAGVPSDEGSANNPVEKEIPVTLSAQSWMDANDIVHNRDTYVITVPKSISLNANIGEINLTEEYIINVTGGITEYKQVAVSVESNNLICNSSILNINVEQGKSAWNSSDCIGIIADNKLSGTDSNEILNISGIIDQIGVYEGSITYTASLDNAPMMPEQITKFYDGAISKGELSDDVIWWLGDDERNIIEEYRLQEEDKEYIDSLSPEEYESLLQELEANNMWIEGDVVYTKHCEVDGTILHIAPKNGISGEIIGAGQFNVRPFSGKDISEVYVHPGVAASGDISYLFSTINPEDTDNTRVIIDVSYLDVSDVTNMSNLFSLNQNTVYIKGLNKWNTSNVTDMSYMFSDLGFRMFQHAWDVELNLSNFDTSKVKNMQGMFNMMSGVTTLNIGCWDTSSVENMHEMFSHCDKLSSIENICNWNTSNVTNMNSMFYYCYSLNLDVSNWNVAKVVSYTNFNYRADGVISPDWYC